MIFYTNGPSNERLRITSDGIVGIGTNNPAANTKLEVIGALQVKNLSSSDSFKIILRDDSGSYNYYQIGNQDGSFYIRNSAQGRNDISVLSTGKVGIATDTITILGLGHHQSSEVSTKLLRNTLR